MNQMIESYLSDSHLTSTEYNFYQKFIKFEIFNLYQILRLKMSKFVRLTRLANNIDEVIPYIKSYFPIKTNDNWSQIEVIAYENTFDNNDDAFEFLEHNFVKNTIHVCRVNQNTFAYIYQI